TPAAGRTARARTARRTRGSARRSSPRAGTPALCVPVGRPRRSRRLREHDLPYPGGVVRRLAAQVEAVGGARAVARDDVAELVPLGLGVLPHVVVALPQCRVRHLEPELPDLRHVAVEELLPRLLVALALDPPDVHRVFLARDRVAVELHQRPPPARE